MNMHATEGRKMYGLIQKKNWISWKCIAQYIFVCGLN